MVTWQIFTRPASPDSHFIFSAILPEANTDKNKDEILWAGPGSRPLVTTHRLQLIDNPLEEPL